MAKTLERQYPLVAVAELTYADLPDGEEVEVFDLPPGAVVVNGGARVTVVTNAQTSSVLDVGDEDDDDRYITDLDTQSLGQELFTTNFVGQKYPEGGKITATRAEDGNAATAGKVLLWVEYVIEGRANEVQAT